MDHEYEKSRMIQIQTTVYFLINNCIKLQSTDTQNSSSCFLIWFSKLVVYQPLIYAYFVVMVFYDCD